MKYNTKFLTNVPGFVPAAHRIHAFRLTVVQVRRRPPVAKRAKRFKLFKIMPRRSKCSFSL